VTVAPVPGVWTLGVSAVDAVALGLVAVLAVRGAIRGFAWQAIRTGSVVLGFFLGARFGGPVGAFLVDHVGVPASSGDVVGWALVWLATYLVGTSVAHVAKGSIRGVQLGSLDRLLGAALGGLLGLSIAAFALVLWASTKQPDEIRASLGRSVSVEWMARLVRAAKPVFPEGVVRRWEPVLDSLEPVRGVSARGRARPSPAVRAQ
jgi:uncharacterized membrane protein required for colicin V production